MSDAVYKINGKTVTRAQFLAQPLGGTGLPMVASASCYPNYSRGLGCHPKQINEMKQAYADQGIKVDYTKDGRAVIESRKHRAKLLRAAGMVDEDAGYSDPTRR